MSFESQKSVLGPLKPRNKKLAVALGLILGSTAMSVNQMGCGIDAQGTGEFAGAGGEGGQGGMDSGSGPDAIFPVEDASTEKDSGNFPDAKPDVDAGMDADAGKDADVMVDASVDASSDADADVGIDASVDAGPDADADAGVDASVDAGPDADVDAGVDASVDAGPDADVDAGMDASVDAGPDADVDAGCIDIPVTFKNMSEYVLRVYSGSCNPAAVTYSSLGSFTGAETSLCLKTGDIAIVQVHDNADLNAVEFDTTGLPVKVKKVSFGVTSPITAAEADAYCPDSAGWSTLNVTTDDKNPAANAFKYEGGAAIKSNGYKLEF